MSNWSALLEQTPKPGAPVSLVGPVSQNGHGGLIYQRIYEWISYPESAPMQEYRDDPNDSEEPIKERPAPWWTPRSVGFRAKILVNPLGGEVRIASRTWAAYVTGTGDEQTHLTSIADRVIAWEYVIVDEDGSRRQVEPPAVGGWERFYDLPSDVLIWLRDEVLSAHLPKAPAPGPKSGNPVGSGDEPIPTTSDPEPERPDS